MVDVPESEELFQIRANMRKMELDPHPHLYPGFEEKTIAEQCEAYRKWIEKNARDVGAAAESMSHFIAEELGELEDLDPTLAWSYGALRYLILIAQAALVPGEPT